MVEIIQQIGASGLVAMPTQADLNGDLGDEIRYYYQAARLDAAERIPRYRLAWDTAVSAFDSRQVLYERFFFGDPVQGASAVFKDKDRSGSVEKVRRLLEDSHRFGL
jgi:4-hydroxyphenylacetate 3-monooxygenase